MWFSSQTPEGGSLLTIHALFPLLFFPPSSEEEGGKHGVSSNEEASTKLKLLVKIEKS